MDENNIKVELENGKILEVVKNTDLASVAKKIGSSLYKNTALAIIDGKLKSLSYEIDKDSKVKFLNYDSKEAVESIRYTVAFLLSYVLTKNNAVISSYDSKEKGFYCDFKMTDTNLKEKDLKLLTKEINKILKANKEIKISEISNDDAINIFNKNKYVVDYTKNNKDKTLFIAEIDGYKNIIEKPLITNLTKLKNFELKDISATNWKGDITNESLQRLTGISFVNEEELIDYQSFLKKYEKINHRKIGKEQDLFLFSDFAPGMPFYTNNGQILRMELQNLLRKFQFAEDYEEVSTPYIMDETLWKNSGHWNHYKDNMYFTSVDEKEYALKPMNCPGHMIIYQNKLHSYRDLPIRMAEFGQVHRHELSGSLNGLFRVRTFNQDDAHIYVRKNQIEQEITKVLNLVDKVYKVFGFEYDIELSTRPDDYMGERKLWDFAESSLENVLKENGIEYKLNEKDGAFYGPKIDIHIKDALNRSHQCGTIQLDFQMPEKFDLSYINEHNKKERPVVIHRAIYGSIDRFIGILLEHFGGVLPLWLSPIQVNLIPVNNEIHADYVNKIKKILKERFVRVKVDDSNEKMGYKIRNSQIKKIPYTVVLGDQEVTEDVLSIRKFGEEKEKTVTIESFLEILDSSKN